MTDKTTGWKLDNSYARLPATLFTSLKPTSVSSPELVILNEQLAESLGLDPAELKSKEGIDILSGNRLPEGSFPIAQAYAGHQFGQFTMLGDGRAILLGEQMTPGGERIDIQLKGSGRTPYSRGGDGRAALGPMLREYIISEAMYGLGIPTNRSLAVTETGEPVIRETDQPGAVLTRTASSHIRVGTFQYVRQWGTYDELKELADYTIKRHYPVLEGKEDQYLMLLKETVKRQASLIAKWIHAGFIHGVMNTDNMAISGETIDYGPCAFMNTYDPATVFSSIDFQGRYAFGNQPQIAGWNLARFAETLLPLLHDDEEEAVNIAQGEISEFKHVYSAEWLGGMRLKLGLFTEEDDDYALADELLSLMKEYKADYTNTFRALTLGNLKELDLFRTDDFSNWQERWKKRLERQNESAADVQTLMKNNNPAVIPRNHLVEEALNAAVMEGDFNTMKRLLNVLTKPYAYSKEQEDFTSPPEPSKTPYKTYCGT